MKKILLSFICVVSVSVATFAQNTLTATPSNFSGTASSGFFDVTISLQTDATNISSFDLFLMSSSPNVDSGNFMITLTTSAILPATPAASGQNPDPISTSSPYASGSTAFNTTDQGFSYDTDQTITGSMITLETLRFSYNFGSTPAPGTSFTFTTTPSDSFSANGGAPGTYFYSDDFGTFNTIDNPASFTLTFSPTAVPEPSTWFAGLGAATVIGYSVLRRRQTA